MKPKKKTAASTAAPKSLTQKQSYQNPHDLASLKSKLNYLAIRLLNPESEYLRWYLINQAAQIVRQLPPEERDSALVDAFRPTLLFLMGYELSLNPQQQEISDDSDK